MELTFKTRITQQPSTVTESIFTDLDFWRWKYLIAGTKRHSSNKGRFSKQEMDPKCSQLELISNNNTSAFFNNS